MFLSRVPNGFEGGIERVVKGCEGGLKVILDGFSRVSKGPPRFIGREDQGSERQTNDN